MFGIFKSDPVQKMRKRAKKLYEEAMHVQRSGDLRLYAQKMKQLDELENRIAELKQA